MPLVEVAVSAVRPSNATKPSVRRFRCTISLAILPIEHLVDNVKSEMRGGIGKDTDSNHPTHVQGLVKTQDAAQRPHRERDEKEYQCPIPGALDQLSDWPRIEPNRVGIVNRLAERREQAHQCDDTKRRYAVAGVAPNFELVSQRISPMNPIT